MGIEAATLAEQCCNNRHPIGTVRSMTATIFEKRGLITVLLLVAFGEPTISAELSPAVEHSVRQPTGFFVMQQVDHQNISDAKLASPKLTGIVIRQRWSAVEPAANTFDWKFIDGQAGRAKKLGCWSNIEKWSNS
jgi:hypothetical protein